MTPEKHAARLALTACVLFMGESLLPLSRRVYELRRLIVDEIKKHEAEVREEYAPDQPTE